MPDTGKLRPEFTSRGVFVPWAAVLGCLTALLVTVLIPLWLFTIRASFVADQVDSIQANDQRQDSVLIKHGEDIAALKAKGKP